MFQETFSKKKKKRTFTQITNEYECLTRWPIPHLHLQWNTGKPSDLINTGSVLKMVGAYDFHILRNLLQEWMILAKGEHHPMLIENVALCTGVTERREVSFCPWEISQTANHFQNVSPWQGLASLLSLSMPCVRTSPIVLHCAPGKMTTYSEVTRLGMEMDYH